MFFKIDDIHQQKSFYFPHIPKLVFNICQNLKLVTTKNTLITNRIVKLLLCLEKVTDIYGYTAGKGSFKKFITQDRGFLKKVIKRDTGGGGAVKKLMPLTQNFSELIFSATQFSFLYISLGSDITCEQQYCET